MIFFIISFIHWWLPICKVWIFKMRIFNVWIFIFGGMRSEKEGFFHGKTYWIVFIENFSFDIKYGRYHISRLKPRMLTKTRRKDGSICHKHQNGEFDCYGSLPSTVMAIPNIKSSEETTFKWTNLPVLIHSSGKIWFQTIFEGILIITFY